MDLDILRTERLRDASRLMAEFEAWKKSVAGEQGLPHLGPERAAAIEAVVGGYCLRQTRLSEALRRATLPAKIEKALEELADATVEAEGVWQFFRHQLVLRANPQVGEPLQLADACAEDGYLELARWAGLDPAKHAPPLVCPEAMFSPVTYPRRREISAPGLMPQPAHAIPLPLVLIPPSHLTSIWQQTTLHHEVGHDLDGDLGLCAALAPEVERRLAGALLFRRKHWNNWLGEILADLIAVLLAGDAFAYTLAGLFSVLRIWSSWDPSDAHPPPAVRAALLVRMIHHRVPVLPERAKQLQALTTSAPQAAPYLPEAEAVVDALLETPLPFCGRALRDVAPDAARDAERALAKALLAEGPLPDVECPLRLVPSSAQIALLEASARDEALVARIQGRALEYVRARPRPAWMVSPERWTFLRDTVRSMAPTERDGERGGIKRPPLRLLERNEEVSFVGATNGQLARSLAAAMKAREGRRWKRIEVFFLADEPLAWMEHEGKSAAELRDEKRHAVAELGVALPDLAETFAMYEYDRPFFFASFWDVEAPHGRIHVSPQAWGQDIRTCPSIDYIRDGVSAGPAFETYLRGLHGLREVARRIAS